MNSKRNEVAAGRRIMPEEYMPMTSEYLRIGRRPEIWHINWVEWNGHKLLASTRLEGGVPSKTDNNRFHVSILAAREMEAQLAIIAIHLKLGLSEKKTEVWNLETNEVCKSAITDPNDVRFAIDVITKTTSKGKTLALINSTISDQFGGLFILDVVRLLPINIQDIPVQM